MMNLQLFGYDDGYYFGQAKVVALATKDEDNGKTVTLTNGTKTYTGTMADGKCVFTVPGKDRYTIRLGSYSRAVDVSYGECVGVYMAEGYELVYKKNLDALEAELKANFQAGVDSVYNAIVAQGTTPASKALSDVVDAIASLSNNRNKKEIFLNEGGNNSITIKSDGTMYYCATITVYGGDEQSYQSLKIYKNGQEFVSLYVKGHSATQRRYNSIEVKKGDVIRCENGGNNVGTCFATCPL